jgi:uncharacterized protein YdhG (YjbR/CyaY superfamily)
MRTLGIPRNTDEYIAGFPENIQEMLNELRSAIRKAAPEAEETISYRMPAYRLNGVLVYFAAQKNHIGFYPTSSGVNAFREVLSAYKISKGAIQFPLDKPMPLKLVSTIVKFRVKENSDRKGRH